jgi:hypothetical protein
MRKEVSRTIPGHWRMLPVLLAAALIVPVHADRPARPVRYMTVAPDGLSLFIMVPDVQRDGTTVQAHGMAFELTESGDLEPLWQVEGWYARVHLASGGEFLVREGPWASGPPGEELAVAFYERGREIRRYAVSELLVDPQNVVHSVSHYQWQGSLAGYPRLAGRDRFQLTTIEGELLTFNVRTGEIVDRQPAVD